MARQDVHVHNESDGFVVASLAQRGRGLMPGSAAWNAALASGHILPVFLEREDPVNVRVVVGDALDAAEQAEWVGRIDGGLRVPDGQLALCGGAAYLIDADPWTEEYARLVAIPPGRAPLSRHRSSAGPLRPHSLSTLDKTGTRSRQAVIGGTTAMTGAARLQSVACSRPLARPCIQ